MQCHWCGSPAGNEWHKPITAGVMGYYLPDKLCDECNKYVQILLLIDKLISAKRYENTYPTVVPNFIKTIVPPVDTGLTEFITLPETKPKSKPEIICSPGEYPVFKRVDKGIIIETNAGRVYLGNDEVTHV